MSEQNGLRLTFFSFAALVALRDIFHEIYSEDSIAFTFWIFLTITVVSAALLWIFGEPGLTIAKLRRRPVALRAAALSALAAVVYLTTFIMIDRIGAGSFNLIDYGLAPLLTAAIGFVFFQGERPRPMTAIVFLIYLLGLRGIATAGQFSLLAAAPALLSPVASAAGNGLTKWLLDVNNGGLSRSELLLVRFLPATPLLGIYAVNWGNGVGLANYWASLPVALLCGFLPLWLLCTGLGKTALNRYAVWEFLIPAFAYFGTLYWHPEHRTAGAILAATLMLASVIVNEVDVWWMLRKQGEQVISGIWTIMYRPGAKGPATPDGHTQKGRSLG